MPRLRAIGLRALAVAWVLAVLAPAAAARAGEPAPRGAIACALDVTVDPDARTVRGTETVRLPAVPTDGEALFYLYPNRLATPSPGLSDIDYYWHYPGRFSPGGMSVTDATQDGHPLSMRVEDLAPGGNRTLLRVAGVRADAGGGATIALAFSVQVPERFGEFGCTDDTCVLMGGFYPMLAARDAEGGWDLHALPARADFSLAVHAAPGEHVVALGRHQVLAASGEATFGASDLPFADLLVTSTLHARERRTASGADLEYLDARAPPPAPPDPRPRFLPYVPEDYGAMVLDAAARTIHVLESLGVRPPAGRPLLLVACPLRDQLAVAEPDLVLVSDRIFRIFPLRAFRKFHELALARALATTAVTPLLARDEPAADMAWVPDAIGAFVADLYTTAYYGEAVFAGDLLKWVAFVPQIDQLLYAPTAEFTPAYFQSVAEPDPFRDSLLRWNDELPRGKLVYEKLRDLVGDGHIPQVIEETLGGTPLRRAAEAVHGGSLGWFFAQWLGPLARVNYRLVAWTSDPAPGGGFADTIAVEKQGDTSMVEPVEVAATDEGGKTTTLTWDGRGAAHVYAFHTTARVTQVVVDPRGRLVESDLGRDVDPRFDDRDPHRFKFVYNALGAAYDTGSRKLSLSVDFNVWRVHDLKNALRLAPFKSPAAEAGLLVEYERFFGPKADPHRLAGVVSTGLIATRLDPTFSARTGSGETVSLLEGIDWDDRDYLFEPWRQDDLSLGGSATAARVDGVTHLAYDAGAGASLVRTPVPGTTLGANLAGSIAGGDLGASSSLLVAGGGASGLRGYADNVLLGRAEAHVDVELRQVYVHDLDWNLGHLVYVRGFGGVLFADAGSVSTRGDYRLFRAGSIFCDAGYSQRVFFDYAGVTPEMLSLDFAVPLVRTIPGRYFPDGVQRTVPGWELLVSFVPSF